MTGSLASAAVSEWDRSQEQIITSPSNSRLLVEAGPGTGKTAVSCARLHHLVSSSGIEPSKAWMISFTRTAVAEIRARLHGYLGDNASAVKIATVDSHAWAIHSGFDENAKLTGTYEANIQHVLGLVRSNDEVADYLEGVEHLILDEAQDFVGLRADLVEAIIGRLASNCGITVFADEAQAIYGFSEEDDSAGSGAEPLLQRLRANSSLGFQDAVLDTIHRTDAPGLLGIFSEVRKEVLGKSGQAEQGLFARIRESIASRADSRNVKASSIGIDTLAAGALVLFRRRAEALQASQFCNAPHSLRLSGMGNTLPPWIGLCFHDFKQSHMDKQEFATRWLERVETTCPPEYGSAEAWERLVRLGGSKDGSLELRRLRQRLGRQVPPVELASREFGLPGPVIGTIHASKGREADDVVLLLPKSPEFETTDSEEEESRVLFVGSTRARKTLRVGDASVGRASSVDSMRYYKVQGYKNGASAMVEIGRSEDLWATGLVGAVAMTDEQAKASQTWLAANSCALVTLCLQADAKRDWHYMLQIPDSDVPLAMLSRAFKDDMWQIANRMTIGAGRKVYAPTFIKYVRTLGSRSLVLSPDDPQLEKLHSPWRETGFLLAPRVAAFTKVWFRDANG